ncbi:transposase domain-containing protein [Vibrio alginolyticus]|uniref:transposase domain-containing protein n=1 Tax=Vibrio alginolyticus TaxID=663 RepID=UPI003451815E
MLWSVVGMSLFRQQSVWDIANQLDIVLPDRQQIRIAVAQPTALFRVEQARASSLYVNCV